MGTTVDDLGVSVTVTVTASRSVTVTVTGAEPVGAGRRVSLVNDPVPGMSWMNLPVDDADAVGSGASEPGIGRMTVTAVPVDDAEAVGWGASEPGMGRMTVTAVPVGAAFEDEVGV